MATWIDVCFALLVAFCIGIAIAQEIICPKKKRKEAANRITAVVALFAYSFTVLAALLFAGHEFILKLFLIEGVLVGVITMGIVYGIAQAIHWAIKGKPM